MAARTSVLFMLGVSTVAAAGAMYFVPEVAASADEVHVAAAAPASVQVAAVQQPAADDTNCKAQAWPYLSSACDTDGSAQVARTRQVRIISTGRDAPRAVPLPAPVAAAIQPEAVAVPEGDVVTVLPPARPAVLDGAQTADAGVAANGDVDVTGSVKPAPAVAAPARRRVAKVRVPATRAEEGDFAPLQVAAYRDEYGLEVVVRSAPQGARQVFADDGYRQPRYDRPARNDNPLAWLTGAQF
jgi:hypothetical protein